MPLLDVILGDMNYQLGIGQTNSLIRLAGNWSGTHARQLASAFQKALIQPASRLLVSLAECRTIDAQVLQLLKAQQPIFESQSKTILITDIPARLADVIRSSGLNELYETIPSLSEAERKYGQATFL